MMQYGPVYGIPSVYGAGRHVGFCGLVVWALRKS